MQMALNTKSCLVRRIWLVSTTRERLVHARWGPYLSLRGILGAGGACQPRRPTAKDVRNSNVILLLDRWAKLLRSNVLLSSPAGTNSSDRGQVGRVPTEKRRGEAPCSLVEVQGGL